jgi:hypothetical protein
MTKPELVELSASEMEAISAGFGSSSRPRFGKLIVLLLALLHRRATALVEQVAAASREDYLRPYCLQDSRGNCLMTLRSDFI